MNRLLIRCPTCEYNDGVPQTLAEVLATGDISIRRSSRVYTGEHEETVVSGENFRVICGRCGEVVYRKMPVLVQQITQVVFGTL